MATNITQPVIVLAATTKYFRWDNWKTIEIYFSQFWNLGSPKSRHHRFGVQCSPEPPCCVSGSRRGKRDKCCVFMAEVKR
jgi:hypothetical protein